MSTTILDDPQRIRQAYLDSGFMPVRGSYLEIEYPGCEEEQLYCCGMTALAWDVIRKRDSDIAAAKFIDSLDRDDIIARDYLCDMLEITKDDIEAFEFGFDWGRVEETTNPNQAKGLAAWEAVKDLAVTSPTGYAAP